MIHFSGSDDRDDDPRGDVNLPRTRGKADLNGSAASSHSDAILPVASKSPPRSAPVRATTTGNTRTTRLLLVEDDRLLSDALSRMLETAGYTVYVTAFGEDAVDLARAYRFDVVLLDLSLPDMSGQIVLQKLRLARPEAPVIILSGETALESKLEGFGDGADDYVTKPFHRDELLARINAVLRRARASAPSEVVLGPLVLDLAARRALVSGEPVPLTAKEYACLEFLAMRRGNDCDQGNVSGPPVRWPRRTRNEDHRRVYLQASPQTLRSRISALHRNGMGPGLYHRERGLAFTGTCVHGGGALRPGRAQRRAESAPLPR